MQTIYLLQGVSSLAVID